MKAARLNERLLEQYIMAGSEETGPEQLRVLAEHFCDKIRLRVAENPQTPRDVLRMLACDPNHDVRVMAGCNPECPQPILRQLARDEDVVVRHGLAQCIETPRNILEQLVHDENGWVRGEALKTLSILDTRFADDEVGLQRQRKRTRIRGLEHEGRIRASNSTEVAS